MTVSPAPAAFGKKIGGGRRAGARTSMPLPAMMVGVGFSCRAELIDVSATGARLRGQPVPQEGTDVEVQVERTCTFATVIWSRGDQCGVRFASPLASFDVARLRRAANLAKLSKLSVDELRMLEDWMIGLAR
jgi:hypothetical protein